MPNPVPNPNLLGFQVTTPQTNPQAIRQMQFVSELAAQDLVRGSAANITLVATSSFTIVQGDDPNSVSTKVINVGDEFQISSYDLPRYVGRGRVKT